jgi:hypothetical protein
MAEQKKIIFVLFLFLTVLFTSCATNSNTATTGTYNHKDPYRDSALPQQPGLCIFKQRI